jgi:hypothetical protein
MERILAAWDEHLVNPYLPRTLAARLAATGFQVAQCEVIPLLNAERDANTYSHGPARRGRDLGVGAPIQTTGDTGSILEPVSRAGRMLRA